MAKPMRQAVTSCTFSRAFAMPHLLVVLLFNRGERTDQVAQNRRQAEDRRRLPSRRRWRLWISEISRLTKLSDNGSGTVRERDRTVPGDRRPQVAHSTGGGDRQRQAHGRVRRDRDRVVGPSRGRRAAGSRPDDNARAARADPRSPRSHLVQADRVPPEPLSGRHDQAERTPSTRRESRPRRRGRRRPNRSRDPPPDRQSGCGGFPARARRPGALRRPCR